MRQTEGSVEEENSVGEFDGDAGEPPAVTVPGCEEGDTGPLSRC